MIALTSDLLNQFAWLDHGFGTRQGPTTQQGMVGLKQIHSNLVLAADSGPSADAGVQVLGEADALITDCPSVTVSIRTADCLPILLVDPQRHAVAAIHAGWRGTVTEIAAHTVERMRQRYGTHPADLYAAIGPGIGKCCYEVSEDVASQFGEAVDGAGKARLDLADENLRRLIHAGVRRDQVDILTQCTFCNAERFYSYRREGERAGRMISFITARTEA